MKSSLCTIKARSLLLFMSCALNFVFVSEVNFFTYRKSTYDTIRLQYINEERQPQVPSVEESPDYIIISSEEELSDMC